VSKSSSQEKEEKVPWPVFIGAMAFLAFLTGVVQWLWP